MLTIESSSSQMFAAPSAMMRPMPLIAWNERLDRTCITQMLECLAEMGFGGGYIHPRPGLITEYLSDEWFEMWEWALAESKRLGLICNIYDENSYPSGFAGGHVVAANPRTQLQMLESTWHDRAPISRQGELLATWLETADGSLEKLKPGTNLDDVVVKGRILIQELRPAAGNPWTAGFPYTDLLNPETAREFLKSTHESYRQRFGKHFGETVQSVFTDEPLLTMPLPGYCQYGSIMSHDLLREYQLGNAECLLDRLADLVVETPTSTRTRFQFYKLVQRLWTGNFLRPVRDWCAVNHLNFTGHFMEHAWPQPFFHPDSMDGFRFLHYPGIDLLAPDFHFDDPASSADYLMTIREAASMARVTGAQRTTCETHGVGGYEATLEQFKRLADWIMVHGINHVVPHLSFQSITGSRKYDHPQTFSDHSPWWQMYRPIADHIARTCEALVQGNRVARVLVLHPTTTGWIFANPHDGGGSGTAHDASRPATKLDTLKKSQASLVQFLADHQVDFDLGDELVMEAGCEILPDGLVIGKANYRIIVLPAVMENLCSSTLRLLKLYLEKGNTLLALGLPPSYIDGVKSDEVSNLAGQFPGKWISLDGDYANLIAALDKAAPKLISKADGTALPAIIGHQARQLERGEMLHFLVNSANEVAEFTLQVECEALQALDTATGELLPVPAEYSGGVCRLPVKIERSGHLLLITSDPSAGGGVGKDRDDGPGTRDARITSKYIKLPHGRPVGPYSNMLAVDYFDIAVQPGMGFTKDVYGVRANKMMWQAAGFAGDPWDRAVQFRRNLLEHSTTGSLMSLIVRIQAKPNFAAVINDDFPLHLGIERGSSAARVRVSEEGGISLVGGPLEREWDREPWLDRAIHLFKVTSLDPGVNCFLIEFENPVMLDQIDRVYLLGEFAANPGQKGFEISVMPGDVSPESPWTRQGFPMFAGNMIAVTTFSVEEALEGAHFKVEGWSGAAVQIVVRELSREPETLMAEGNVIMKEVVFAPPYETRRFGMLSAGTYVVEVTVAGTLKNLLGPHHCTLPLANRWTTPAAWEEAPMNQPPGEDYEILDYKLPEGIELLGQRI